MAEAGQTELCPCTANSVSTPTCMDRLARVSHSSSSTHALQCCKKVAEIIAPLLKHPCILLMPGRIGNIDWEESTAELEQEFRGAPTVGLRKRLQVLWLVRSGRSAREAARLAGVGERTAIRWLAWYRAGGLTAVLRREPGWASRGRPAQISHDQQERLAQAVRCGDVTSIQDARSWLAERCAASYSYHGGYSLLRRLNVHPARSQRRRRARSPGASDESAHDDER